MSCPAHDLARSRKMLSPADVDLIREVVAKLPSNAVVVDVGAGSGTTALAVFAQRVDVRLVSIENDVDTMNWARLAVENIGASEGWDDRVEDELEAAASFPDGHASFIILDAAHTEREVRAELAVWLPKLVPGGFVMIHDYDAVDAPNFYAGVKIAVDEFIARDEIQRVKQQGWSILAKSTYSVDENYEAARADAPQDQSTSTTPDPKPKRRRRKKN